MKILLQRCHTCGALGIGPGKVKLLPMNGVLYCETHWRKQLDWEDEREIVIRSIKTRVEFDEAVAKLPRKHGAMLKGAWQDWEPYIQDLCGLAEFALTHDDRKTFVYYFSRAMWAWDLSQEA